MSTKPYDAMVLGGGLAGSAAAISLARAGRTTVLLERESQPHHKVCGEFLSQEALTYLRLLGVDLAALGALKITSVRLAARGGVSEVPLPFPAMSLTRRRLDEELLRIAKAVGVAVCRGVSVQSLERDGLGWKANRDEASPVNMPVNAAAVFLATGKHDLRGRARPAGVQSDLIAFKMYWRLATSQAAALDGCVELNLYRGGYAGLQPVEGGLANLCCLVRRADLQRMGGRWESLLQTMQEDCSHLAARLRGAEPMLAKPLAITAIPYGFVRRNADGVWALGDQAAVIPSFTGDGMSIALHSGLLAARMYLQGRTADDFQRKMHDDVARQVAFATMLSCGLVSVPQRAAMVAAVRLWPGLLRVVANRTRLPEEAVASQTMDAVPAAEAADSLRE